MAARLNLAGTDGGAAALVRASERAAAVCPDEITQDDAAKLARVSYECIQHAWLRGDLRAVQVREDQRRATFSASEVRSWALSKRLIFAGV